MLILGDTPQEKGKELESITLRILSNMGYIDCSTNVMSGGGEIDVQAKYALPQPGGREIKRSLVCECKALQSPVDITQWYKFLGKVYHLEKCEREEVRGCLIALSGVNGHVQGAFNELVRGTDTISLVHGEELQADIRRFYAFAPLQDVATHIAGLTTRPIRQVVPTLYHGSVHWLVQFAGDEFTLLSADSQPLKEDECDSIVKAIIADTESRRFVDLLAEETSARRALLARTIAVSVLMCREDGCAARQSMLKQEMATVSEMEHAIDELAKDSVIRFAESGYSIFADDGETIAPDAYRELFTVGLPVAVLGKPLYDRGINESLVAHICEVQKGLKLSGDDIQRAVRLLRLSPTGLREMLQPQDMLTRAKERNQEVDEESEQFCVSYFFQHVVERLRDDFRTRLLHDYIFRVRGLRELAIEMDLTLKTEKAPLVKERIVDRLVVGRLADSDGGGYILAKMLPGFPEPWEEGGMAYGKEDHEGET